MRRFLAPSMIESIPFCIIAEIEFLCALCSRYLQQSCLHFTLAYSLFILPMDAINLFDLFFLSMNNHYMEVCRLESWRSERRVYKFWVILNGLNLHRQCYYFSNLFLLLVLNFLCEGWTLTPCTNYTGGMFPITMGWYAISTLMITFARFISDPILLIEFC